MGNSNWWASKLGTPSTPPAAPSSTPPQIVQQIVQQTVQPPTPQIPQVAPVESCPNCRSGNYGKMTAETRARCYDCGYPIVQQGSGIGSTGSSKGPAQAARQATGSGFNPGTIVGKL